MHTHARGSLTTRTTLLAVALVVTAALTLVGASVGAAPVHAASGGTDGGGTIAYSNGRPRDARITIPAVGIRRLPVIAYRGRTDDAPGTRIQDRGLAAAPYGPRGGIGPGGIGNYQVTAHRTVHGGVFRHTPSLHRGDVAYVDAGRWRYVYRVTGTRWVSFRSAASLRAQRAPVPGHPGEKATIGYLTISTCATPEDFAAGRYWTDSLGNPTHRIDKIGILVKRLANPAR